MNAKTLMDSLRFRTAANDFAKAWAKRSTSEEEKEIRLEAFLSAIGQLAEAKPKVPTPVVAGANVDEDLPPIGPGVLPPSKTERAAAWAEEAYAMAQRTQPNQMGERVCIVPLDWNVDELREWANKNHPKLLVGGSAGQMNMANPMEHGTIGYIVPFRLKD